VAPRTSRGRTRRNKPAASSAVSPRSAPPGSRCASSTCSRFSLGARLDQVVAVLGQRPQRHRELVELHRHQPSRRPRGDTHRDGVSLISFRPWPVESAHTRAASFAGTSNTASPSASEDSPAAHLTRPHPRSPTAPAPSPGRTCATPDSPPDWPRPEPRSAAATTRPPPPPSRTACADQPRSPPDPTPHPDATPNLLHHSQRELEETAHRLRAKQASLQPLTPWTTRRSNSMR
jgi:hypothetical protein